VVAETLADRALTISDLRVLAAEVLDVEKKARQLVHSSVMLTRNLHAVAPEYSEGATAADHRAASRAVLHDRLGHSNGSPLVGSRWAGAADKALREAEVRPKQISHALLVRDHNRRFVIAVFRTVYGFDSVEHVICSAPPAIVVHRLRDIWPLPLLLLV